MKESTLSFMLERKWITQEEYDKSLPSPKGDEKATKAKKKKVESWEVLYLKTVIPQMKGCTIQHVHSLKKQAWTAEYPDAKPHGIRTRSYTDADSMKSMARHCVEWTWQQHRKANPSKVCPWDFGDAF